METMANNTPNMENGLYNPFTPVEVDPRVTAMKKPPEERMYIVLYYNTEYEEFKHAIFYGRYDVYFGIKNILDSESIDIEASTVLVETVGIDPTNKEPKRYLIHPDNASNIIDFCKQMEVYFGENAYSLAEYGGDRYESEGETDPPKPSYEIKLQSAPVGNDDLRFSRSVIDVDERSYEFYGGGGGGGNYNPDTAKTVPADLFMDSESIKNGGKYFLNPATMDTTVESKEI